MSDEIVDAGPFFGNAIAAGLAPAFVVRGARPAPPRLNFGNDVFAGYGARMNVDDGVFDPRDLEEIVTRFA